MPAGLKHNFGSMTKPMHAGQAARSGLTAAYLAAEGFTASDDAIGAARGFIDLYSGDTDPDFETIPTLGEQWGLIEDGIQVKKFPCCYFTHPGIAAALALREQHNLTAEEIASVEVTASQGAADALHYTDPDTGLEGKFSMQYPRLGKIVQLSKLWLKFSETPHSFHRRWIPELTHDRNHIYCLMEYIFW